MGKISEAKTACSASAKPASAPASGCTCMARAAPMPCDAVPNAKPRTAHGLICSASKIYLPLIAPTTFFLLIMNLISSFTDSFGLIDTLTEGGPNDATVVMVYKIYFDGFKGLDYSGAAAQSIVLMLLVISLTFIQFKWVEKKIHYA